MSALKHNKHSAVRALTLLALATALAPAAASARARPWSSGTADTLPEGRLELGLFQPLRYGAADGFEVSSHVLLAPLMPNVRFKLRLLDAGPLTVAARQSVYSPTVLLGLLARGGTGGILPPDTRVPVILGLDTELLATYRLPRDHLLTTKLSALMAIRLDRGSMPTIDLPLVFARTAAIHNGATLQAGVDLDGRIWRGLWYLVDVDLFVMPDHSGTFAVEHSLMLNWYINRGWSLHAGYKLVYGDYPFGQQLHMLPLVDFQKAWDL